MHPGFKLGSTLWSLAIWAWTNLYFNTEMTHLDKHLGSYAFSPAPSNYTLPSPVVGELKVSIALQSYPSTTPRKTLEID